MKSRPAETGGGLGAVATGIALALGTSAPVVGAIGIVAGALPAAVTWIVAHGGIRGALRGIIGR